MNYNPGSTPTPTLERERRVKKDLGVRFPRATLGETWLLLPAGQEDAHTSEAFWAASPQPQTSGTDATPEHLTMEAGGLPQDIPLEASNQVKWML